MKINEAVAAVLDAAPEDVRVILEALQTAGYTGEEEVAGSFQELDVNQLPPLSVKCQNIIKKVKKAQAATPPAGLVTDATFEAFASSIQQQIGPLVQAASGRLASSLAASGVEFPKLLQLRQALCYTVLDDDAVEDDLADTALDVLCNKQREATGFPWDYDILEPNQRNSYIPFIKKRLGDWYQQLYNEPLPRSTMFRSGNRDVHRFTVQGLPFPVSAKNDEIACLRGQGTVAGLLGLELKKDLERKNVWQMEVEYVIFSAVSEYPFCQLVTDLGRGGVAIWTDGREPGGRWILRQKLLNSMEQVYTFMAQLIHNLPQHVVDLAPDSEGYVIPRSLPAPKRMRMAALVTEVGVPAGSNDGDGGGGGGTRGGDDAGGGGGGDGGGGSDTAADGSRQDAPANAVAAGQQALVDAAMQRKAMFLIHSLMDDDVACLGDVEDIESFRCSEFSSVV